MTQQPINVSAASNTHYHIIPRKVAFDWNPASDLLWIKQDPFGSHWGNTFHYLLTQGEKFFCRTFREALPLIKDEKLRADVEAFIAQEAIHSAAHHQAIKHLLAPLDVDGGTFERQNQLLFDELLSAKPFGKTVPRALAHQWLLVRVGIVAAIEHFTAALGAYLVEEVQWDNFDCDPVVSDLYRWHGAEEVEHRNVAYDLYRYLGGNWPLRVLLMGITFPVFMERQATGIVLMAKHCDPQVPQGVLGFLNQWRQSAQRKITPGPIWFVKKMVRFVMPGYHPVKEACTDTALAYIANSQAVKLAQQSA